MNYRMNPPGVGVGQLLLRISQFNEYQARRPSENQMTFWREFVSEFFYHRATYKYIVWLNDHETRSFQLFQLGTETLPRFYNVLYSSSISSVYYVLQNPREYCLDARTYLLFSSKTRVEYKYENGCRVITKGFLRVTFSDELKIIMWEFEAKCHNEYIPTSLFKEKKGKRTRRHSLNGLPEKGDTNRNSDSAVGGGGEISLYSLPKSQVNQFGLPPPVMRCFEITEVINYMKDLIDFATDRQLSPMVSLEKYHHEVSVPELQWASSGRPGSASGSASGSNNPVSQPDQDKIPPQGWPQRMQRGVHKVDDGRYASHSGQFTHAYPLPQGVQGHYGGGSGGAQVSHYAHHPSSDDQSQNHYQHSQQDDRYQDDHSRPMTPSQQQQQDINDDRQEHEEKDTPVKQEGEDIQIKEEKHVVEEEKAAQDHQMTEVKHEHDVFEEKYQVLSEKQQQEKQLEKQSEKLHGQHQVENGDKISEKQEEDEDKLEDDDDEKETQTEKELKLEERTTKPPVPRKRGRKPRATPATTRTKRKKTK